MNPTELLNLMRSGKIEPDAEYRLSAPLVLGQEDNGRVYDLQGAHIVSTAPETALCFGDAKGVTLKNMTLQAEAEIAVLLTGAEHVLVDCTVQAKHCGVLDRTCGGTLIEACQIAAGETCACTETDGTILSRCYITGGTYGVRACYARAELSAAMGKVYNLLVAENRICGASLSLCIENAANSAVVCNQLETATLSGCIGLYVIENQIFGQLTLSRNRYLIANGNATGALCAQENSEVNGSDLTDLSARAEIGVNEALLPHINPEQFVGMARKRGVRTASGTMHMQDYIVRCHSEGRIAILPPGAYANVGMRFANVHGLSIYAYGVLDEMEEPHQCSLHCDHVTDFTIKGMFFDHNIYPTSQGTVLSFSEDRTLTFCTDPGYHNDFTDWRYFGGGAPVFHFLPEEDSPECEFRYASKSYDPKTNVNTLNEISAWWKLNPGDRVALRTDFGEGVAAIYSSDHVIMEDCTVFCCCGFAVSDVDSNRAPTLHRYAVVQGPAPVLAEDEPIPAHAEPLIWRDAYGRRRSAKPMFTSCDATHCTNARRGMQIISSVLERMNDDGGNINAYYGLTDRFDAVTRTLTYTRCNDPHGYRLLPAPFRKGDSVMLYTMEGELVDECLVESDSCRVSPDGAAPEDERYTVVLSKEIVLPRDKTVAVQNTSASGNGFLLDNNLFHKQGCRGIRIKCVEGEVRNCTFDGVSKGAIDCIPEFQLWPECGYARDVRIHHNVFRDLCRTARLCETDESEWCAPICLRYTLWNKGANATADPACCLHRNIEISENLFEGRYSHHEVTVSAVGGLRLTGNRFAGANAAVSPNEKQSTLLVYGGRDILLSGNDFTANDERRITYRYGKESTANVTGADLLKEDQA